ncbi:MAG: T9SS type A sorting domain-containing protein [Bacteroidota bacterium]
MIFKKYTVFILSFLILSSANALRANDHLLFLNNTHNWQEDFKTVIAGGEKDIPVSIWNTTTDRDEIISEVKIIGADRNDFLVLNSFPFLIDRTQKRDILVRFKPKTLGQNKAARIILYYDGGGDSLVIDVTGNAVSKPEPKFILLKENNPVPGEFVFDPIPSGTFKNEGFQIKNDGGAPGQITKVEVLKKDGTPSPVFTVIFPAQMPPVSIPENGIWSFGIHFEGDKPGNYEDTLVISTGAGRTMRFSIKGRIKPLPLRFEPKEFNFGVSVKLGDSAIRTVTIFNDNFIEVPITQADIVNDNKNQLFKIEPANQQFVVPAKGSRNITVKFMPNDTNQLMNTAFHLLVFNQDQEFIPIRGKGQAKSGGGGQNDLKITVTPTNFEFTNVPQDSVKILEVQLKNENNETLKARDFDFFYQDTVFSIENNLTNKELELARKNITFLYLKFSPKDQQEHTDSLTFKVGDFTYYVVLKGKAKEKPAESFSTTLALDDDITVAVGDTFSLPVRITNNGVPGTQSAAKYFAIELRFTSTVLYPMNDIDSIEIKGGERILKDTVAYIAGVSELMRVPFLAALGDMSVAQIRITQFTWLDEAKKPLKTVFNLDTAAVTITGTDGRLINANKGELAFSVSPNPSYGDIQLEFTNYAPGATVKIYNTQGVLVRDLSNEINFSASASKIPFHSSEIPEGAYFCRLTSDGFSIVRTIFVRK